MNYVSFYGSETAGSVGKRNLNTTRKETIQNISPRYDNVSFRGHKEESSFTATLLKTITGIAVLIGGIGLAHKANLSGAIKNKKFKNILNKSNKITEPCYNICHKAKELGIQGYNKIKDFFSKKK